MLLCFQIDTNCLLLVLLIEALQNSNGGFERAPPLTAASKKLKRVSQHEHHTAFLLLHPPICMISRIGWFLCSFFEKNCENVVVFVNKSTSTNLSNFSLQLPQILLCCYWQQRRIRKVSLALNVIFFSQTLILLFKKAANNPHHPTLRLRQMNAFVVAKSFDKTNPNNSIAGSRKKITKI